MLQYSHMDRQRTGSNLDFGPESIWIAVQDRLYCSLPKDLVLLVVAAADAIAL